MQNIIRQLEVIKRGCVDLVTEHELVMKLKRGRPLRVKLGMDPTAPDIHLGHVVVLQKMRDFQDLGHKAVLIIGDYTAMIGDPSGENKMRPVLTEKEIKKNAKTYLEQAGKVLDLSKKRFELRYNSEWLKKLSFADVVKLASNMTVARMLERDSFEKRYKAGIPIGIHEFLYPLMQGYDSVMIKSDVELGGTDQTFNNLVGRDVQRANGQEEQTVLTMPLLVGLDGTEKMSKSKGNYVGVTESAGDMFGKLMSVSDDLMWDYYKLLSRRSIADVERLKKRHPKEAKVLLSKEIVARFHSREAADNAEKEFEKVFSKRETPTDIEEVTLTAEGGGIGVVDMLVHLDMVPSRSEARRLIRQGGVSIGDNRISDINHIVSSSGNHIVRVGKRRFKRVRFK